MRVVLQVTHKTRILISISIPCTINRCKHKHKKKVSGFWWSYLNWKNGSQLGVMVHSTESPFFSFRLLPSFCVRVSVAMTSRYRKSKSAIFVQSEMDGWCAWVRSLLAVQMDIDCTHSGKLTFCLCSFEMTFSSTRSELLFRFSLLFFHDRQIYGWNLENEFSDRLIVNAFDSNIDQKNGHSGFIM